MREEGSLIRLFAKISEDGNEIHYHKESWEGPKVSPRRFYPSRLVKLVRKNNKDPMKIEYVPDSFELINNAPQDAQINAYVLGDYCYFSSRNVSNINQSPLGPSHSGSIKTSEYFGSDETDQRLICVSYCMVSQKDLDKKLVMERG